MPIIETKRPGSVIDRRMPNAVVEVTGLRTYLVVWWRAEGRFKGSVSRSRFVPGAKVRSTVNHIGTGNHPVVVCDNFTSAIPQIISLASSLAPFPGEETSYYPGVRRAIGPTDRAATEYVDTVMKSVVPLVASTFDASTFVLLGASFSIVTRPPGQLLPMQRVPHYDSLDPDYIALIHYIRSPGSSATAFFRQRSTGIERVEEANVARFVDTARREIADDGTREYMRGGNRSFEEVGRVEAVADRLVFYQGSLLHSAIIPPDMPLEPNPRRGRLTANFFLRIRESPAGMR